MIELRKLTKDYGTTLAVNNLSLTVSSGQIYGFIGPNGAGKTTTIRMMGGIIEPTAGNIMIAESMSTKTPSPQKDDRLRSGQTVSL
jgi:ABC-type multidrug transport system ATPase subunit